MRYVLLLVMVLVGGSLLFFRRPYVQYIMKRYEKCGWPHGLAIERFVMAMNVMVSLAFLLGGVLGLLGVIKQP